MTVTHISSAQLPTQWGEYAIHVFIDSETKKEHVALVYGELNTTDPILCRVHSECLTGDALFSLRCDCGAQLSTAMQRIVHNGSGIILYLRQEGRNIGLGNKIKAYDLQDKGADTVEANEALGFAADERLYDVCVDLFKHFNINKIDLMTNNPVKVTALENLGISVNSRQAIIAGENTYNESYLATKRDKLGHMDS